MRRHEISDDSWDRIKDMLPGRPGQPGWIAQDNRLFINAVLWIGKTGAPWRDPPRTLGQVEQRLEAFRPLVHQGGLVADLRHLSGERP